MQCDEDDEWPDDKPEAHGHRKLIRSAQEAVAIPKAKQRKRRKPYQCSAMIAGRRGMNGKS